MLITGETVLHIEAINQETMNSFENLNVSAREALTTLDDSFTKLLSRLSEELSDIPTIDKVTPVVADSADIVKPSFEDNFANLKVTIQDKNTSDKGNMALSSIHGSFEQFLSEGCKDSTRARQLQPVFEHTLDGFVQEVIENIPNGVVELVQKFLDDNTDIIPEEKRNLIRGYLNSFTDTSGDCVHALEDFRRAVKELVVHRIGAIS